MKSQLKIIQLEKQTMSSRLERFKALQKQRKSVEKQTSVEVYRERQRNSTKKPSGQQPTEEESPEDERKKIWNYSVEDNEKWDEMTKTKRENKLASKYNDYDTLAERTYLKKIAQVEKAGIEGDDVSTAEEYNFDHKPSEKAVEFVTNSLKTAEANKIAKTSKTKKKNSAHSGAYINKKNKDFNEKIERLYGRLEKGG